MLYEWLTQLRDAMTAAGLDARVAFDPDRGPGVVIGPPAEISWDNVKPRVACGDIVKGTVRVILHIQSHGWAPEQMTGFLTDLETTLDAIPPYWTPRTVELAPGDTTLPEYRITLER